MQLPLGAILPMDAEDASVTVGPREDLERDTLTASRVNWMSGEIPTSPILASARKACFHWTFAEIPEERRRSAFSAGPRDSSRSRGVDNTS